MLWEELAWFEMGLEKLNRAEQSQPCFPLGEFERRAERHFRALLARHGADENEWRRAVREDAKNLSHPVARPDLAIETTRAHATIKHGVESAFPSQEKAS